MGRAFAMRLMHLGATSFVVGETITPSIQENDVFVAISGSGKTEQVACRQKGKSSWGGHYRSIHRPYVGLG
jgi:D-arabinose 5-phosphate isomerase GutQ